MEITPQYALLTVPPGARDDVAKPVSDSAWALERHLADFASKVNQVKADKNLSARGQWEKITSLARAVVDGLPGVGPRDRLDRLSARRDRVRGTVGNRFALTRLPDQSVEQSKEIGRELRAELRQLLRDTPEDRRDVELSAIIDRAVSERDRNLLFALFDGASVAPSLSIVDAETLDQLEERLFEAWEPEAFAEVSELESAVTTDRANRGRAVHAVAKIAGVRADELRNDADADAELVGLASSAGE